MITQTLNQFYADIVVYTTFHTLIITSLHNSQKTHNMSMGLLQFTTPH